MARTELLSRRALKRCFRSLIWAPLGKVNLTAFLSASPMQRLPSRHQTGTPIGLLGFFHFTSSTTEGSAVLTTSRKCASMALRQPPGSATIASICSGMDGPLLMATMLGGRNRWRTADARAIREHGDPAHFADLAGERHVDERIRRAVRPAPPKLPSET